MKTRITLKSFLSLMVLAVGLSACGEDDVDISKIPEEPVPVEGPIDLWLKDSLLAPYNIRMQYKWDQFEFGDVTKTLVPPKEELILPVSRAVISTWINPYVVQAGKVFFNKYSPKTFVMSGSVQYLSDGSVILGQAEGGRKIVLFDVNNFRVRGMTGYVAARDSNNVKQSTHTLQHEFGHILHQTKFYPVEFKTICKGLYQGQNWINVSDATARRDGFITSYASSAFDEDFVETIAMMLVEGKGGWDKMINDIPAGFSPNGTSQADAQAKLRRKEALVVNYYKTAWNIDFYALQKKTRAALIPLL